MLVEGDATMTFLQCIFNLVSIYPELPTYRTAPISFDQTIGSEGASPSKCVFSTPVVFPRGSPYLPSSSPGSKLDSSPALGFLCPLPAPSPPPSTGRPNVSPSDLHVVGTSGSLSQVPIPRLSYNALCSCRTWCVRHDRRSTRLPDPFWYFDRRTLTQGSKSAFSATTTEPKSRMRMIASKSNDA